MKRAVETALALAGALGLAPPGARGEARVATVPLHLARMYEPSSATCWAAARAVLAGLDLADEKLDARARFVRTRARKPTRRDALAPVLPPRARSYLLQVFVSPYAEPCRVYLNSIVEAEDEQGRYVVRSHDLPALGERFFLLLEERLREAGRAVPALPRDRRELARRLRGDAGPDPCADLPGAHAPGDGTAAGFEAPSAIEASMLHPRYPHLDELASRSGRVVVVATIQEDGAVTEARVEDREVEGDLGAAAVSAVRLWRFRPARRGGCTVPAVYRVTVSFKLGD